MTTTTTTQLPDVLGALTGGARAHFGVLQAALALRPPTVNAGRALEAVLLVQNTCDQMVDLSVTLLPPEQDAKKQRGKFVARSPKLVVAVKPGEVGCVLLLVATLRDTAPGDYKLAVEIAVKSPERSRRVREAEGGGSFKPAMLSEAARPRFAELKPLSFSANKPVYAARWKRHSVSSPVARCCRQNFRQAGWSYGRLSMHQTRWCWRAMPKLS